MRSMKFKFVLLLLTVGLLAACAAPSTPAPVSQPTAKPPAATATPTTAPAATDTSVAVVENTPASDPAGGATVSFSGEILPLIESRCINCHGGDRTEEGLSLRTHADILAGSENGAVIVPGDAANSLLAEMVAEQKMPKRGPKLTPPQVQLIIDWINQGALDN